MTIPLNHSVFWDCEVNLIWVYAIGCARLPLASILVRWNYPLKPRRIHLVALLFVVPTIV